MQRFHFDNALTGRKVAMMALDMTEINDLTPLAARLNASTDELNEALDTIQSKLNALNLGVEVWLDEYEFQELDRRILEIDSKYRKVSAYQLGYGRIGTGWALLVRERTWSEVYEDDPDEEGVRLWAFDESEGSNESDRKALRSAPRALRVKAVGFIPALLTLVEEEAARVIDAVEQAKQIAKSLK